MRGFLLGLAVGALSAYAASKLVDEETRENLYGKLNDAVDKTKGEIDHGMTWGKGRAMRAGVRVRQEVRKGKKKLNQITGDVAEKLSDELSEIKAKARANA